MKTISINLVVGHFFCSSCPSVCFELALLYVFEEVTFEGLCNKVKEVAHVEYYRWMGLSHSCLVGVVVFPVQMKFSFLIFLPFLVVVVGN